MYFYITAGVGLVLLGGAAYHYKEADRTLIQKAQKAALSDMANARASLPKWDDKNYKGLTHRTSR